nr:DinB family protein [Streptomyces sp. HNM0574]
MTGGERESLRGYLDFHRSTLALKCEGLTDEQLRLQAAPPSDLSLLGLVRHMAEVERVWFRRVLNSEDLPLVWSDEGDFQAAYDATDATREDAFAAWHAEVAAARRIEPAVPSLDTTARRREGAPEMSLRRIMLHLIQEYARHNGHADLLRQAVDGGTGI